MESIQWIQYDPLVNKPLEVMRGRINSNNNNWSEFILEPLDFHVFIVFDFRRFQFISCSSDKERVS